MKQRRAAKSQMKSLGEGLRKRSWIRTMTFQVGSHVTEKCSKESNVKPYKEGVFQNPRSGTGAPFRREPLRGRFGWCLRPIEKHGAATRHILARPEKVES